MPVAVAVEGGVFHAEEAVAEAVGELGYLFLVVLEIELADALYRKFCKCEEVEVIVINSATFSTPGAPVKAPTQQAMHV